jgi:hypothetical protein
MIDVMEKKRTSSKMPTAQCRKNASGRITIMGSVAGSKSQ